MIKFTMGSCDNKKTHRRKPKRTSKSYSAALPIGHQTSVGGGICCTPAPVNHALTGTNLLVSGSGSLSDVPSVCPTSAVASNGSTVGAATSSNPVSATAYLQNNDELQLMQKLMDAQDYVPARKSRDYCIICHCPLKNEHSHQNLAGSQTGNFLGSAVGDCFAQAQRWMCGDCHRSVVEEDDKRASLGPAQEPLIAPVTVPPADFLQSNDLGTSCGCDSCKERRRIQEEHDQEMAELQKSWLALRHSLRHVYDSESNALTGANDQKTNEKTDDEMNKLKELVERLCAFDPHELFKQVDASGREYVVEIRSRLAKTLPSSSKSDSEMLPREIEQSLLTNTESVSKFVAALLDEYDALNRVCQQISVALAPLERLHLSRFRLTIELNFRHLFHNIIYADLQKHLSNIVCQLRELSLSKEVKACSDSFFTLLLHRYLIFDDEMTKTSSDWRECYQLIEQYNDEQATIKAKQKMMQENFDSFQARRRVFEQHMLSGSGHSHCPCIDCNVMRGMMSSGLMGNDFGLQSQNETVLGYATGRPVTPPQFTYIDAQHLGLDGAGDGTGSHLFVPYIPAFEFAGGEMPEEFDEDGSYQDDYSEHHSLSEQSSSPAWKEQRLAEGQDSLSVICGELLHGKQTNSSSVDSGTRCDGSDDVDNDDADDEEEESDSSDESKFIPTWLPADQQRQLQAEQVQQQQQHVCQCHYCYQQQMSTANIVKPAVPFFLHPTTLGAFASQQQQPHHLQHGPSVAVCLSGPSAMLGVLQTPAGYGSSQQQLLLPQLYQLQCPAPTVMQSQYCAADSSTVGEQTLTFASHVASSGNNWQNLCGSNKCSNGSSFASPVVNSTASWTNVSMLSPIQPGCAATTTTTTISPGASVWRIQSPNGIVRCPAVSTVFSASSSPLIRSACATVNQPVMYSFPNVVGQQPGTLISMMGLQFAGVSGGNSDVLRTEASSVNSDVEQQSAVNGFGSLPLTTSSPGLAIPSVCTPKCLSTSTVTSAGSLASHSVGAQITSHACQRNAVQGTLTNSSVVTSLAQCSSGSCHQHINALDDDNEFEEDDDEESGSDESSGTSNQKDGKYCECWHCEFFGHSAPQTVPTSKNYPEMRDRLRLRLKKKYEQKLGCQAPTCEAVTDQERPPSLEAQVPDAPSNTCAADKRLMNVDEIVEFINSGDAQKAEKASRKAAKRARQKQRKAAEKVVSVMAGEPQQASSLHQQISQDSVAHCLASSKADRQQSEQLSAAPACSASFVCDVTSAAVHSKDQQPISKKANMKADINVSSKSSMVERHDLKCCTNSKGTTGDVGITSGSNVVGGRSSKVNIARKPVQQLTSESGLVNLSDNDASMKAPGKLEVQRTHRNESMKPETCVSRRGQGKVIGRTSKIAAEPSSVAVQSAPSFPLSGAQQSTGVDKLQSEIQMSKSTKGKGQSKLGGEKPVLFSASSPMDMQTLNHIKQTAANCVTSICQPVSSIQGSNGAACCQSWNLPTSKAGVISRNCVPVTSAQKSAISDVAQAAGTVKPAQTVTASAVDNSRSGQFVLTQKQPAIVKSEPRNGCALGSSTPSGLNQVSPFVDTKNSVGTSNGVASVVSAAAPCSVVENGFKPLIPTSLPVSSVTFSRPGGAVAARVPENFPDLVPSDRKTFGRLDADVSDAGTGKNKKSRRKAKGKDGLTAVDKIFLPKDNVETGRLDDFEREIEEFKRFCFNSTPADNREKLQVNMNLKDIFAKKKNAVA